MTTRTEKQQEILNRVYALLPRMTDAELDRLIYFGVGADFMLSRREDATREGAQHA